MLDTAPGSITVHEHTGKFLYANRKTFQMHGYEEDEFMALNLHQLDVPESEALIAERVRLIQETGEATFEVAHYRKDGTTFPLEVYAKKVMWDGSEAILSIATDITERKQSEQVLRESEERYRFLLESITDSVYVLDREWRHTLVNDAAESFTGIPKQTLLGNKLTDLFPGIEQTTFFQTFQRVMDTRIADLVESEYTFADGRKGWYEVHISPVPEGILCISVDITEHKQAEMKIFSALREKEALLREIHHRVKNNLNLVTSLLDLQSSTIQDEQAQRAFLESQSRIRAIARLHEAIYRSADLARIDPGDYLQDLCHHLMIAYARKQDNISLLVDIEPLWLDLDTAVPCGLILNELVSNALKHAFPPGWQAGETGARQPEVLVSLRRVDDLLALEVTDNGIGFPTDVELAAISTLGLQLVSMFAQQLEGKFELQRLTRGSRFCVSFPAPVLTEG